MSKGNQHNHSQHAPSWGASVKAEDDYVKIDPSMKFTLLLLICIPSIIVLLYGTGMMEYTKDKSDFWHTVDTVLSCVGVFTGLFGSLLIYVFLGRNKG